MDEPERVEQEPEWQEPELAARVVGRTGPRRMHSVRGPSDTDTADTDTADTDTDGDGDGDGGAGVATLAHLRTLVERTRPTSTADQRVLPALDALAGLLPDRGLRRGSVLRVGGAAGVGGATSLALALAAGPSRAGSWVVCVGLDGLGLAAAVEAGLDPSRLVVVRSAPDDWAGTVAALVDAADVVLCGPDRIPSVGEQRRLGARARERGAVLVALDGPAAAPGARRWPTCDLHLEVVAARWRGLGAGWGHLESRVVTVEVSGRGAAGAGRRRDLLLPGPDGAPAPTAPARTDRGASSSDGAAGGVAVVPRRRAG